VAKCQAEFSLLRSNRLAPRLAGYLRPSANFLRAADTLKLAKETRFKTRKSEANFRKKRERRGLREKNYEILRLLLHCVGERGIEFSSQPDPSKERTMAQVLDHPESTPRWFVLSSIGILLLTAGAATWMILQRL
jgi:hypothetical protein